MTNNAIFLLFLQKIWILAPFLQLKVESLELKVRRFKLHIYNPEHDIALAKNDGNFTPPKAARITRETFWYVPALWADEGDWILKGSLTPTPSPKGEGSERISKLRFVSWEDLSKVTAEEMPSKVEPWGWDKLVVSQLVRCNSLFKSLVPTDEELDEIRRMSSRTFVAENILPQIIPLNNGYVGKMTICHSEEDILHEMERNCGSIVLKSPWSCSGRGVRFVHEELTENERGWIKNTLNEQGAILAEPIYNKVLDFAMEFKVHEDGVVYLGLNIFETREGKYIQNIGSCEEERLYILQQYISLPLIEQLKNNITSITSSFINNNPLLKTQNSLLITHFGIDMIIVKDGNETKVHPCVEMNLRHTMGGLG